MTPKKIPSLTIFFPAYNDAETIGPLTDACLQVAKKVTDDFEILIVDDHGPDNTAEVADDIAKRHPEVRVIHHATNRGVGQAMITGFTEAKKDFVFYTDGDYQYDMDELTRLAEYAATHDLVIGYRLKRAEGFKRVFTSRCFHLLVFFLFGIYHRDIDCSFKLVRKEFLRRFSFQTKSALVDPELLIQARRLKSRVKEVGVHHYARRFGTSQCLRVNLIVSMIRDLFRLRRIY